MDFFVKSGEWGMFFVKKWTFPERRVHDVQHQYVLFYILLIWGGVRMHPTHLLPPAYVLVPTYPTTAVLLFQRVARQRSRMR